ncbi:MAG: cbb3-type cytochrome c oxidase subunit I [Rhodobacteraceae bacterium]|nr:cbb3-type cytochrome c oxidase subunit I [Paracoccaceae bacterium]
MAHEHDNIRTGITPHWIPEDIIGKMTLSQLLFSNDYRHIAIKGVLTSMVMLGIGGTFAIIFRTELMVPDVQILGARVYMTLMTLHGMFMVFVFLIPLAISLCYYMMPKVLGTEKLLWSGYAQASYWTLIAAAVLLIIGRPDFTWTAYAPMSLRVGDGLIWMGYVAIMLVAISEFLAGLVLLRNALAGAKKVGWSKLPMMGWGTFSVGVLLVVSTIPLLFIGFGLLSDWMQWFDTAFFDPARGGSILTFLYVFWTYGHPAVYLPFIPVIAVLYTLMPRFLGRPMWSHWSGVVAFSLLTVFALPIGPHHFQPAFTISGPYQRMIQILTMLVFIPSVLHVFNWIATLWAAPIPASAKRAVPFKFMIAAIAFLIYGGATAYLNGQISVDTDFIHNSYWIPAHFHAMFFGFVGQMAIGGIYYLYPYLTGRMYNQRLANAHFWMWQIGIFTKVTMMFYAGYAYFPRWVYDYLPIPEWVFSQFLITMGAYLIGLGFLVFIFNFAWSAKRGTPSASDPWAVEHDSPVASATPAE